MTSKKQGLKSDPKRQAHNQLRGYRYQILHSVDAWLELADNEILYLECAEDFDKVSDSDATVTQVKATQDPITLRSGDVNDAINNYWELRTRNPDRNVKFRFLTQSEIGEEKGNPFGTDNPGIQVWGSCSGDEESIKKISNFLQTEGKISGEVDDFLKQAEPQEIYKKLIEPIAWETASKSADCVEQSIRDKLVVYGFQLMRLCPSDAEKVAAPLIDEAWRVATLKERRELTKASFLRIIEKATTQTVSNQRLRDLEMLESKVTTLGTATAKFLGGSSEISIQSHSSILNAIPPILHDVTPRTDLITRMQAKLQSEGIVVVHGGAGRGKTTLAKLIATVESDSWLWLTCTIREPSPVERESWVIDNLLKQLAIQISSQSSPVNIVLDDLNLQPQELRGYKETLGVVVYRVLELGAKLLITSQYKPPNSFIRQLDVSPSIVVHVPDFTLTEIEHFAKQLGCPADGARTRAQLIQLPTRGHPRLVHAWIARLRDEDWKQDINENILHPPPAVVEEREAVRQLLINSPEDQREFLYRLSLMATEFRKDYAINIGEIPHSISHPGDVFDRLVGPWIDPVDESYFTISPLLRNAAQEVWSESKIIQLHAQIANAILKATKNVTPTEAWAVLWHSIGGHNREAFIEVIGALMTAPEKDWEKISQEFSMLIHIKIDPPEELFPGDAFVNHLFRSLQYRIAVDVEPESAPKILEFWDKETKPYEPQRLYLQSRLMLVTEALMHCQASLSAKQIVAYLKEIIDITENDNEAQEIYYRDYIAQFEEQKIDTANYFSFLFSFIYRVPRPMCTSFFGDLINGLDKLPPKIRTVLLADFEDDTVDARLLIDAVWWAEANLENPDWNGCLQVFEKVIEKAIAWGYPHLVAASARGKAVIHDEYLHSPDDAHKVLQDIIAKVGTLPVIEEEQANVYFGQQHYKEALSIYERILPEWNPPSEQVGIGPLEEYRRAAICASQLEDWAKAATFLKDGAKRTQRIEKSEAHIGLHADAGFAQFKANNMRESIKLLHLALKEFEKIPQDNTNLKYFTLKQRLAHTIRWMAEQSRENNPSELVEPLVGMCSNPEPNEKILTLPDFPMGYAWVYLAQVEYRFGHGMSILEHALQNANRDAHPVIGSSLSLLQVQHDFRNKTFDNLPQRIHQLANAYNSMRERNQTEEGVGTKGTDSVPFADLSSVASVKDIVVVLVTALLIQLRTSINVQPLLVKWRFNSSELPIKENFTLALDLIESMLSKDLNNALTVMNKQDAKYGNRLTAALKIVHSIQTSPDNLFYAHVLITTALIGNLWEDFVVLDLAEFLSAQWLEKIKLPAMLKTPVITVPLIEQACKGSDTGKKKIGKILLAAHQAVSLRVPSTTLQQFRSWTESMPEKKPEPKTEQNPIAQEIIKVMEDPPHLTYEDGEALRQSIEEGKLPVKYDSPFDPDEPDNQ